MTMHAPWTAEQVASLNDYQQSGVFHEFTCGNELCPADQAALVAAEDGWRCPSCTYSQDWAHDMMADGSWRDWQHATITVDGEPVPGKWEIGEFPAGGMGHGIQMESS